MSDWWNNLAIREKQMLLLGTIFIIAFSGYFLIFSPLINYNQTLREKIANNQKLLTWMQQADAKIKASSSNLTHRTSNTAALISLLQKNITHADLAKNLIQLEQSENNGMRIGLKEINFDTFIAWLINLAHENNLQITQLTITPINKLGLVNVNLIITA